MTSQKIQFPSVQQSDAMELLREQKTLQADFVITNDQYDHVSLEYLGADCSCVGVSSAGETLLIGNKTSLKRGESYPVAILLGVKTSPGEFSHSAVFRISVDGKEHDPIALKVTGKVLENFSLEPAALHCEFRDAKVKSYQEQMQLTRTVRGKKLTKIPTPTIGKDDLPSCVRLLEVKENETIQKLENDLFSQSWTLKFEICDDGTLSGNTPARSGIVTFPKSDAVQGDLVTFTILVRRCIGIDAPEDVVFGSCPLGETRTRRILLRSADDQPFQIRDIVSDSSNFSGQLADDSETQKDVSHWLELAFRPEDADEQNAVLTIRTNHFSSPELHIRLNGTGK